jgi:hypothetical protein
MGYPSGKSIGSLFKTHAKNGRLSLTIRQLSSFGRMECVHKADKMEAENEKFKKKWDSKNFDPFFFIVLVSVRSRHASSRSRTDAEYQTDSSQNGFLCY